MSSPDRARDAARATAPGGRRRGRPTRRRRGSRPPRVRARAPTRSAPSSTARASRGCVPSAAIRRPARGDPAPAVDRSEPFEQFGGGVECGPRRRVEPGQAVAARRAPRRDRQRETREVGRGDLGSGVVVEMDVVALRPAAVHDSRRLAARAACPLVRRRLRHPRGDERAEPAGVVDPRHAREAGVDDDPHPRHGQRALRDGRRQDDPAATPLPQRTVLLGAGLPPEQRQDVDPVGTAAAHRTGDDLDLPLAGQEDEDVAVGLGERAAHDVADVIEHPRVDPGTGQQRQRRGRRHPHDVDAERRRPARDRRRGSVGVAQHAGHRGGVGGGRRRDAARGRRAGWPGRRRRTRARGRRRGAARGTRR